MPLRVIRLSAEECQRWCSCLESNYICRNRTEPHALAELFLAHEALSRTAVYVVAESGQEATDWRYVSGTSEIVCHNNSLYVNGNRLRTDLCPRRSAMAANTAPRTPPHPTVRPLLRRSSSLSSVPEMPSVDTAAPGSLPSNIPFNIPPLPSFVCPIGHEIMRDPVIAADGFSYERHNLQRWLRRFPAPLRARSPCTNLVLPSHTVVPNHSLRAAIAEWAALRDGGGRDATT